MIDEPPKLYTNNKTLAAELRKMYPGVEVVTTLGNYPTNNHTQVNGLVDARPLATPDTADKPKGTTMTQLQEILGEYGAMRALAYREHGDTRAYSEKAEELKAQALTAIAGVVEECLHKATVERRLNPLTGETIDLIDKSEIRNNLKAAGVLK